MNSLSSKTLRAIINIGCLFLPLLCFVTVFAQTSPADGSLWRVPRTGSETITEPSPEATAMRRYTDYPIGYATGTVDISIPLVELPGGTAGVNIGLSYHTGGIKRQDISTSVGLGWTMTGLGSVSRQIITGVPGCHMRQVNEYDALGNILSSTTKQDNYNNLSWIDYIMARRDEKNKDSEFEAEETEEQETDDTGDSAIVTHITVSSGYSYDRLGRLSAISSNTGTGLMYGYDMRGRLTSISNPAFSQKLCYEAPSAGFTPCYNGNRPVKVVDYADPVLLENSMDFAAQEARYSYDSDGRLTADTGRGITENQRYMHAGGRISTDLKSAFLNAFHTEYPQKTENISLICQPR